MVFTKNIDIDNLKELFLEHQFSILLLLLLDNNWLELVVS